MKYVGARYMPKFLGTYDNTTAYEALSVVDNGMGTSYVSNKPVPAGTPLTDTDYWAVYGMSSGAILNLQQQIDDMNDGTVPGSLQNQIGDITDLDTTDKDNLVDAINEHDSEIQALANHNKVTIGMPEDFGAVGDGVNDDTQALQDCVDNCKIVLLNNTYLVNSSITVPKGVIIYGLGKGVIKNTTRFNVIILSGDNTVNGVKFTDTLSYDATSGACVYAEDTANINILNCEFDTIGNGHCVLIEHSEHLNIDNNTLKDYGFNGIMLQSTCSFASISYNKLYNARYRGTEHNYPICFSAYQNYDYGVAHHISVNYNEIEEITPYWEGIDSHGARDCEVIGNTIKNCRCGITLGSTRTSSPTYFTDANINVVINNNNIDVYATGTEISYGINVEGDATTTATNIDISNNNVKVNNGNSGTTAVISCINVRFDGVFHNVNICNNRLHATNCHGIALDGSFETVKIDNNYCDAFDTTEAYHVISLRSVDNYSNITISNNSIDETLTTGRFIYGPSNAPIDNKLIDFVNNYYGNFSLRNAEYITSPKSALAVETKASGVCGQFIPSNANNANGGWLCKSANNWLLISGTSA